MKHEARNQHDVWMQGTDMMHGWVSLVWICINRVFDTLYDHLTILPTIMLNIPYVIYRIYDISHMRYATFTKCICDISQVRYIAYALCKCWISHMRYLTLLLEGLLNDHNGCGRHGWYLSILMIPIHASCCFLASIHHVGSLLHASILLY